MFFNSWTEISQESWYSLCADIYNVNTNWNHKKISSEWKKTEIFGLREINYEVSAIILFSYLGKNLIEISYLFTALKYLRKGKMNQLIGEFLQNNRGTEVWLEVSDRNEPALNLYIKHGFKEVGMRPNYYSDQSNAILMRLK